MSYYGTLIHRERLQRDWSQGGLCSGICAVSYLSKIEQGKVVPSEEVLQLLLKRLDISVDKEIEEEANAIVEAAYEALCSGEFLEFNNLMTNVECEKYRFTTVGLDFELLKRLAGCEELEDFSVALEYLQACYDMAAKEGAPRLMLLAKMLIGNCYCNQVDLENMSVHYRVAERLAKALHDMEALETIRYNTASAQIEKGDFEEAYTYFSKVDNVGAMALHKLAICCEKLGKKSEALEALSRAGQLEVEYPDKELVWNMCEVVRFRLEHEDYLNHEMYGSMLLSCFEECRKKLPIGYSAFHLPWVLEWYTANRQYKKAYDLVMDFPVKHNLR